MNSEALVQAAIRAVIVAVTAGLGELLTFALSPGAADALGQFAIYLPIIIGLLQGVLKAVGGPTTPTERAVGRGAAAGKRPNIFAI